MYRVFRVLSKNLFQLLFSCTHQFLTNNFSSFDNKFPQVNFLQNSLSYLKKKLEN